MKEAVVKTLGLGFVDRMMTDAEMRDIVMQGIEQLGVSGKRLLVIIPDHTRTAPIGEMFRLLYEGLAGRVAALDYLVALGTHPAMSEDMVCQRVGLSAEQYRCSFPAVRFFNHLWKDPQTLTQIGTLTKQEVGEITDGLFEMEVPITINEMVFDYDLLLVVGPVFPHEVVGFSGGNKYLFPGIAGQQIIDFFHWLGAVITNPVIIGNKWTPVRRVVDRAAAMVSVPRAAFCMVVEGEGLAGMYFGTPEESWSRAADLSNELHITYRDCPYHTVLSRAPQMYDDIWTAGKCMYKLEPVVADGGDLIIYAPHVTEISATHGRVIEQIGYHTRDYFLKQWDRYKQYPWGVIAHSTHVKGIGTYENGVEKPRVNVSLATQIPPEMCAKVNLGYVDPSSVDPGDYAGRENEGVLYVPKAGEMLYRLKNAPPELGGKK